MGQKILAYLFYGFLVLMVIAAIILLKYQLDHKVIKQQQIDSRTNVVTRTEFDETTSNSSSTQKEPGKQEEHTSPKTKDKSSQPDEQTPLSYLDIYQQLRDAKTCQPIFSQWQNEGSRADLTQLISIPFSYYGEPTYSYNEKPPVTSGQHTLLKRWEGKCLRLWQAYGKFDQDRSDNQIMMTAITESIEQRLNKTVAKTPQEIEIKDVLKITLQWQQNYAELEQALKGEDSLNEVELAEINRQIEQLRNQQTQLYLDLKDQTENGDTANQNTLSELSFINQELDQLFNLLKEQKVVKTEIVQQKRAAFDAIDQKLFRSFDTTYGDVFYEALSTVVGRDDLRYLGNGFSRRDEASQQRITPVDMVLEAHNLTAKLWYTESLSHATVLYLCDLGLDCSADSALMLNYCLLGYPSFPESCGLNVRSFYRQHLISPNQWLDVITLKNSYAEVFHG